MELQYLQLVGTNQDRKVCGSYIPGQNKVQVVVI